MGSHIIIIFSVSDKFLYFSKLSISPTRFPFTCSGQVYKKRSWHYVFHCFWLPRGRKLGSMLRSMLELSWSSSWGRCWTDFGRFLEAKLAQDGGKTAQDGAKTAQDGAQDAPKTAQDGPQDAPKTAPGR